MNLIEAAIQKGEDPDLLLRTLASNFPEALGPITDRLIERKSWNLALSLIELLEKDRPAAARARRCYIYLLTGQLKEARRIP